MNTIVPTAELLREAQEQLRYTKGMLDATQGALEALCLTAHELGAALGALVDSFEADDQAAIAVYLGRMSDNRKASLAGKTKVH